MKNIKKFILAIGLVFMFFIKAYAYDYQIIWENERVEVLIDSDISLYEDLPKALVYQNDTLINTNIIYNKGANYTPLEMVSTKAVGSYFIYYEAIIPELNIKDLKLIEFVVYDPSYPEFNIESDVYLGINSFFDLESVKCYDEIDGYLEYKINGSVNFDKLGSYDVYYYAIDSSKNITNYKVTFHIIDDISPLIILKNNKIRVNDYNHDFLLDIEVIDNIDYKIIPNVIHEIDYSKVGKYKVNIYAIDKSNNYSYITDYYYVIDDVAPIIKLKCDKINITKNQEINLLDYVLDISDNYCKMDINNLEIKTNYVNELGRYEAVYQIKDMYNNVGENKLIINVLDDVLPEIKASNKSIKLNDLFDPLKGVTAIDNIDGDITYRINYQSNLNTSRVGLYEITYSVYDSSGNYNYKIVYVNVIGEDNKINFPEYIKNEKKEEVIKAVENKKFNFYYLLIPIALIIILIIIFIKWRKKK